MSKTNLRYSLRKWGGNGGDDIHYIKVEMLPPLAVWTTRCSEKLSPFPSPQRIIFWIRPILNIHFWVHNSAQPAKSKGILMGMASNRKSKSQVWAVANLLKQRYRWDAEPWASWKVPVVSPDLQVLDCGFWQKPS